jgi:hypothetical protein
MSRIRHMFAASGLLASLLIMAGPGEATALPAAPELFPVQRPPARSASGHPAMPAQRSSVAACVAGSGVRPRIGALTAEFPRVSAAPTPAAAVRRDHRAVTVVHGVVAVRTGSLKGLAAMSRHVWSVPVCRSPPHVSGS